MRAALLQLSVSDDPAANLPITLGLAREAVAGGASIVLTPECTNILSSDREHQRRVLQPEAQDQTLAALRTFAADAGIWMLIGSLAVKTDDPDGRFANRSFLICPDGAIKARYDKIHMFDVNISDKEQYRESQGYRPGGSAVLAQTPFAMIGMSVCYDLRFPHLYRSLAQAGAQILTIPAAFNDTTGAAHWEPLLRARAIENGAFVLAPAQCGAHASHAGRPRRTHGHSLAVGPWGDVLADGGDAVGVSFVDMNMADVARARARVPSLAHDRPFEGP